MNLFAKGGSGSDSKPASNVAPLSSNQSTTASTTFGRDSLSKISAPATKESNGFWDLDDDDEQPDDVDYQTTNLNKLSPEEVQKHKDKMDVLFQQNRKKPGDPGFVYDVQEEFEPHEDNEWDEEF